MKNEELSTAVPETEKVEAPVTEVQESAEQVVEQVQETTEAVDTAASSAEEMMTQMSETVTPDDGGTVAAPAVEALAQEVEQAQEEQLVENIQEASETVEEVSKLRGKTREEVLG